ncbi:uncharacterized protein F4812DRAFT_288103 [Daldinia caldariorum]|uniref:uncharacterized protein n=1 Tax=Daldinia caldariorum TaxID=326644 RepID=UPI0020087002|nr:uncharacterized protein F4812DRAFT_288103 [Daldinia caldariorum]KAI1463099.1 hypothetical protein F4812DRAFT_288103 [Daldinia caldariorum]
MKFINVLCLATSALAVAIDRAHVDTARSTGLEEAASLLSRHHRAGRLANNNQGNSNGNGGNANANAGAVSGNTLVLKEVNGVPGNECLTFRNNGEIVDAACVNTAADRQITPTTLNGNSVLRVQRSFTAGFRPDLVDVTACVGFNGTHFRAEDCAASNIELVQFDGTALRAPSGACAQGHDGAAQMVVDTTGASCASFESTTVTPTPP